jgi:hypothetical protein
MPSPQVHKFEWRAFWPRGESAASDKLGSVDGLLSLLAPGERAKLERESNRVLYLLAPGSMCNVKIRKRKLARKPSFGVEAGLLGTGRKEKLKLPTTLGQVEGFLGAGAWVRCS